MGFKFLKFLQRYIQNDLDLIVSTDPNLLDELMQDCLALIKICAIKPLGLFPFRSFRLEDFGRAILQEFRMARKKCLELETQAQLRTGRK